MGSLSVEVRTEILCGRICELEAENDKLHELVRKAHACKTDKGCCEDCHEDEGCCPIESDMLKLGIEVGE